LIFSLRNSGFPAWRLLHAGLETRLMKGIAGKTMKCPTIVSIISLTVLISSCGPEAPKTPEEKAFIDANNKIRVYHDKYAFGNTVEAEAMAANFSVTMEEMQKHLFGGGGKIHGMTAGNFLTYCQVTPEKTIFLCTVPGMKDYKDDVRDALAELAWVTAQQAVGGLPPETRLVVALKGSLLYGPVWSGSISGTSTAKAKGGEALKEHYPAFLK
jgi:hypothetical protein